MENVKHSIKEYVRELIVLAKMQSEFVKCIPNNSERNNLIKRFNLISANIECPHNDSHILRYAIELFSTKKDIKGCVVEAGAYKGGSTAKLSIIAKMLGRKIYVFDSFEGLPDNNEQHDKSIFGYSIKGWFEGQRFKGALEEVRDNIKMYGEIEVCEFVQGWFEETMPSFREPIMGAILDVDLVSSTKTCIKHLYPLISDGGFLCSQDGDFPLIIEVLEDDNFWEVEVKVKKPYIQGLRKDKILTIRK